MPNIIQTPGVGTAQNLAQQLFAGARGRQGTANELRMAALATRQQKQDRFHDALIQMRDRRLQEKAEDKEGGTPWGAIAGAIGGAVLGAVTFGAGAALTPALMGAGAGAAAVPAVTAGAAAAVPAVALPAAAATTGGLSLGGALGGAAAGSAIGGAFDKPGAQRTGTALSQGLGGMSQFYDKSQQQRLDNILTQLKILSEQRALQREQQEFQGEGPDFPEAHPNPFPPSSRRSLSFASDYRGF